MTEHKNIYAALAAAQGEFGPLVKDAVNPHFKSKYATLAAIMSVALPVLSKHDICILQRTVTDSEGKLHVETILGHGASGDSIESLTPIILGKHDMQQLGSAITYSRRYAASMLLGLAPEDDDDGNAAVQAAPTKAAPVPAFKAPTAAHMKRELDNLDLDLVDATSLMQVDNLARSWKAKMDKEGWPMPTDADDETAYRNQVRFKFADRRAELASRVSEPEPMPIEPIIYRTGERDGI